jgi:hypothetical protein
MYDHKNKRHVINPKTENVVRLIFDEFDTGKYSLDEFCKYLNSRGKNTPTGKKWDKQNLWQYLRNPFFHGEFMYKDTLYPGTQDTYYEKDRYTERLHRLEKRTITPMKRIRSFALTGLLECSCGYGMYGDIVKGKYVYYIHKCRHTKKQFSISESDCFKRIHEQLNMVKFTDAFTANLKSIFKNVIRQKKLNKRNEISDITRSMNDIRVKKDRVFELFADGGVDISVIKPKIDEYETIYKDLSRQLSSAEVDGDKLFLAVGDIIGNIRTFVRNYESANNEDRVKILKMAVAKITMDGVNTTIHYKEPFSFILRPEFFAIPPEKFECVNTMLPRQDSNLRPID